MKIKELASHVFAVIGGALQRRHERDIQAARVLTSKDAIRCALDLPWHASESDIEIAALKLAENRHSVGYQVMELTGTDTSEATIATVREWMRESKERNQVEAEIQQTKAEMAARRMEIYPNAN